MTQLLVYWLMFCTHQMFWKLFLGNWLETKNIQILVKLQLLQFHKNSKFQKNDHKAKVQTKSSAPWKLLVGFDEHLVLKWSLFQVTLRIDPKTWIDHDNAAGQLPSCYLGWWTNGTFTKVIFSFMWPLVTALGSWTCTSKGLLGRFFVVAPSRPKNELFSNNFTDQPQFFGSLLLELFWFSSFWGMLKLILSEAQDFHPTNHLL